MSRPSQSLTSPPQMMTRRSGVACGRYSKLERRSVSVKVVGTDALTF